MSFFGFDSFILGSKYSTYTYIHKPTSWKSQVFDAHSLINNASSCQCETYEASLIPTQQYKQT